MTWHVIWLCFSLVFDVLTIIAVVHVLRCPHGINREARRHVEWCEGVLFDDRGD